MAYAQAERGNLGASDVDPGGIAARVGLNAIAGEQIYQALFDACDQVAHAEIAAADIQQ